MDTKESEGIDLFPEDFGSSRPVPDAFASQVSSNGKGTGLFGELQPSSQYNSNQYQPPPPPQPPARQTPGHVASTARADWRANGERLTANQRDQIWRGEAPAGSGAGMPRWVPDEEVTHCTQCQVLFDWATRKHHCRACGKIFCSGCSSQECLLPKEYCDRNPKRVCDPCYRTLQPMQEELIRTMSNSIRENYIDPNSTIEKHLHNPLSMTLGSCIRKAAHTILNMTDTHNEEMFTGVGVIKDQSIPLEVLRRAKGLAFLTVVKAGFIFAGRVGTGLVISKLPDGRWSAPSAITTVGIQWGLLIGGELTDYVILLNTQSAVDAFSGRGQVALGGELDVALGPVGRSAGGDLHLGDGGIAPAYTYSHSKGLFAGISLEGTVIACRSDMNQKFYGCPTPASDLLSGRVEPPRAAQPLYEALATACQVAAPHNAITDQVDKLSTRF